MDDSECNALVLGDVVPHDVELDELRQLQLVLHVNGHGMMGAMAALAVVVEVAVAVGIDCCVAYSMSHILELELARGLVSLVP